ncbi:hypothetical protein [Nonomuraea aridisoli]|uniref:hypothetical protein n=1 Tax=Nonomuraea aridisoli TaxID=2070368 RepID=UPI001F3D2944|nr:hypothetical protein [Nonomuraea aridisoli]
MTRSRPACWRAAAALTIARAGADIVALDATSRPRPDGLGLGETIGRVHAAGALVMADVSSAAEGGGRRRARRGFPASWTRPGRDRLPGRQPRVTGLVTHVRVVPLRPGGAGGARWSRSPARTWSCRTPASGLPPGAADRTAPSAGIASSPNALTPVGRKAERTGPGRRRSAGRADGGSLTGRRRQRPRRVPSPAPGRRGTDRSPTPGGVDGTGQAPMRRRRDRSPGPRAAWTGPAVGNVSAAVPVSAVPHRRVRTDSSDQWMVSVAWRSGPYN